MRNNAFGSVIIICDNVHWCWYSLFCCCCCYLEYICLSLVYMFLAYSKPQAWGKLMNGHLYSIHTIYLCALCTISHPYMSSVCLPICICMSMVYVCARFFLIYKINLSALHISHNFHPCGCRVSIQQMIIIFIAKLDGKILHTKLQ